MLTFTKIFFRGLIKTSKSDGKNTGVQLILQHALISSRSALEPQHCLRPAYLEGLRLEKTREAELDKSYTWQLSLAMLKSINH